ncbi:MAG: bifunctional [glutamine synthetase] adenylyltransferase/[glutamine synthetase]-adenylyl-L-tyrosine phosphorylase [Actinomycetota bacterium]|nr:bifunctional [glutamine synthetase] adenylyltransferase/[glutamine synthetase]-adenylyl-L-tyrosine phosphorylase [Actinomycetota bacterium]
MIDTVMTPKEVEHSADPGAVVRLMERLGQASPDAAGRVAEDHDLRATLVAVTAASPWLARLCLTDPLALDVLAGVDDASFAPPITDGDLARHKRLGMLRIAGRDLTGRDGLEDVVDALSDLADDVLGRAWAMSGAGDLAIIAMGKLGARELNYASDVDVVLVGQGPTRHLLDEARRAWRVDLDLRPEGRSGAVVRSLDSYRHYWDRWAQTWEFQALLKARAAAGDAGLGAAFITEAMTRVWGRPFGADDLRRLRELKALAEEEMTRRGLQERELKRGRGGIRDIEFAVQLLQLVHGRQDPTLRAPSTLAALRALAAGGYVDTVDAVALEGAYRFLRVVEHRLQLYEDQQVHALPTDAGARARLARVLGYRDAASTSALAGFERDLRRHQATGRSIHERLFFRPLLEAFTVVRTTGHGDRPPAEVASVAAAPLPDAAGTLSPLAAAERLAAFGFSDAERTRQAVTELTRGFSRSSRLMRQLLPLVFEWLSQSPDPDLGLLGLRSLTTGEHRRSQLTTVFRESAEAARQLCLLLGTGPVFARGLERHPDVMISLSDRLGRTGGATGDEAVDGTARTGRNSASSPDDLIDLSRRSLSWRSGPRSRSDGLIAFHQRELLRVAAADVLGRASVDRTGQALSELAESVLGAGVGMVDPQVPFAVIAMGRLGGGELSYASDLDVLFVYDSRGDGLALPDPRTRTAAAAGEAAAVALVKLIGGETPARRVYPLDANLRPEGRQGPLARSLDAFATYYDRWAQTWERQALVRGRFVAGDTGVGQRFARLAEGFVWDRPFTDTDIREVRRTKARVEGERIPAGEDPRFHLKLGRGSLSDIEWTAQLLQLTHGVRATGTLEALDALVDAGALIGDDARTLATCYRFCEQTRNRLFLVRGSAGDALPSTGHHLSTLARSLDATPSDLRQEYRRLTRRARRVVERLFYGQV